MTKKRVLSDQEDEGYDTIGERDEEEETNEYELLRRAKMAENQVRLQACVDAANAL